MEPTTNLAFLLSCEVIQVRVGEYQTQVVLDSNVRISIEQRCELDGTTFQAGPQAGVGLVPLLGAVVQTANLVDERHLRLTFDNGRVLTIFAVDGPYESYSIVSPTVMFVV